MESQLKQETVVIEQLYLALQLGILLLLSIQAFPLLSGNASWISKIYCILFAGYLLFKFGLYIWNPNRLTSVLFSVIDGLFLMAFILNHRTSSLDYHDLYFLYIIIQCVRYHWNRPLLFSGIAGGLHTVDGLLTEGIHFFSPNYFLSVGLYIITGGTLSFALKQMHQLKLEKHFYYTEIQKKNGELQRLASLDFLTGLYNRSAFNQHFKTLFDPYASSQGFGFALIDIDNFKQINDTYGHLAGDATLRAVSEILQKNVRSSDFVARYGGEEFAVVFCNADLSTAVALSERIRRAIESKPIVYGNLPLPITVSIGTASFDPTEGTLTEQDAIAKVDELLYVAKRQGKNQVRYQVA